MHTLLLNSLHVSLAMNESSPDAKLDKQLKAQILRLIIGHKTTT